MGAGEQANSHSATIFSENDGPKNIKPHFPISNLRISLKLIHEHIYSSEHRAGHKTRSSPKKNIKPEIVLASIIAAKCEYFM